MSEIFFIFLGSTLFFGVMLLIVFGFIAFMRWVRYKETLVLAEKGLLRPERQVNGKGTLRWGIVITALGLALSLGLYPLGFLGTGASQFPLRFGPWMLLGLIPMFFGLALVLIWFLTGREQKEEPPAVSTSLMNTEEPSPQNY